jgi:signal transduction histidine kinase
LKRLYLQIYLTVVGSLLLVVVAMGAMWRYAVDTGPEGHPLQVAGEIAAAALPPDAPADVQARTLERLARRANADLSLFDASRRLVASANVTGGPPLAAPERGRHSWRHRGWSVELPDGRSLAVRLAEDRRPPRFAWLAFLALVALAVALAAYPVVRRLTRRLERLQASVERLGEGDLSARVELHGRDEVARLADSFNRAAARIESLVSSHRMLLANASHELRTPLARIKMAIELMKERADPQKKAELERDIAELDELITDILMASRLDAVAGLEAKEEVDLLALAAEECARYDCTAEGEPTLVTGDPRLLRRLIRNLLENANRHGAPPVEVSVRQGVLRVRDHGGGVAAAERDRIFEPFHRVGTSAGTGLGLTLVRQIARRHGGDAKIEPCEGRGTCVAVTIARPV